MKIAVKECSEAELADAEKKWQSRGYMPTNKTDPKTLDIMEYMTTQNAKGWVLARRDPD